MSAKLFDLRARHEALILRLVAYGVAVQGVLVIISTLHEQLSLRDVLRLHLHSIHPISSTFAGFGVGVQLLIGLGLLYVSLYLARRKRTAWLLAVGLYACLLVANVFRWLSETPSRPLIGVSFRYDIALPALLVGLLILYRHAFTVKSDVRSFALSLRASFLVLFATFCYGVTGFILLDTRDFHQEITFFGAMQHTIDQFGLTTAHQLIPHTRRAKIFLDSLSTISVGAVVYCFLALFQPIRARFTDQSGNRALAKTLLDRYPAVSEDFFKLWPHDKVYFFNRQHTAGVAYAVRSGVALVVGDPFGEPTALDQLLSEFDELCRTNDWAVAYVHTEPPLSETYKRHGFSLQKIGEEAVLDLAHFEASVRNDKYFRQIRNKFEKQGYAAEMLTPPHNDAVLRRLHAISHDWLQQPGRDERRFMMGFFSEAYMQECNVMVLRDAAGTIQAFVNQIPSYASDEANFDLLRHTHEALGNSNDYLLMCFIGHLRKEGLVSKLNLGLCPLAGLDARDDERSVVDSALRFVYANGDRFYSFSGLHRFKAKYQPEWQSRYVAYRGGLRGFTRAMNALNRAMKVSIK
ncbi:MAG TPA: phosphatidylglycerol lysyltransferase domain-containing protein [Candidatus Saccharimonadales bacterium]